MIYFVQRCLLLLCFIFFFKLITHSRVKQNENNKSLLSYIFNFILYKLLELILIYCKFDMY